MNKSIAIIETPKNCANCPLYSFEGHLCRAESKTILNICSIAEFCSLRPLPQKINDPDDDLLISRGWNACLEEIEK